ncbi:type VI secretion system membrane subunit TssM [Sulfitobacter sabulilitoris]|uniref:Type VI secretion system membrane subunit TssM n=1 Tax=Sulfitobacter sabulilitoris TaxID=2562655 RepID=A0A5S3PIF4_9RHOB|nr:type VI secretion system membrane subunit TssM [Sulfitobacter sabulilitoris]TMM54139.1 type VI secretion system membrane subunit TssM [Sulfitobacter sabulilitoris]
MSFLRFLGSGIGITLIVSAILSACLWFLGGYLGIGDAHPFDSVVGRLVGLAVLWIVALLIILVLVLRASKKDDALTEDMVTMAEPVAVEDEAVTAELGEMRDKLKAAMTGLRRSRKGRAHLYQLPWYIMIGPPGAGKTTAIVNSGLQFPLSDEGEVAAIGGVGGTRNCDWWFTDNAVLVDTAGRYTTQESDAEADNAAWLGFLGLLKKHRKRQPINGAIIAISLSDLSMQDEITQKGHAQAIRRRLHELRERLGVHFPVYILFTKADLIAGFAEYFDGLGKQEREQVWGFTLPLAKKGAKAAPTEAFDAEFDLLVDQLNTLSLERIQNEADPQRRSMIASFPAQVASVRGVARDFLAALFQDNKYEHRQMLRGVYFTSGTQEGTPIDRLMMGMARTFGIGRQAIGSGRGTGRSYFLTQLFDTVIFREAGLVSADDRVERRYRWTKRASFAAVAAAAIGMGLLWGRSYLGNAEMIATTQAQISTYREQAALIPPSPVGDTDMISILPALNTLRDLPNNPTGGPAPRPDGLGWGLYQGRVIGNEERLTYRSALNTHFLPRLLLRLENQMQASINDPDLLYETLKVYLTLGRVGPLNPDLVKKWMAEDWATAFPDIGRDQQRTDLAGHLDVLMSAPMQPIALNNDLVGAVQKVLTQMPQSQRVYNGIINSPVATALPDWRLTDIGGPAVARAFSRSSGKQLNDGIPGIYTYAGFNEVFLEEALTVAARLQSESWVLGEAGRQEQSEAALMTMSRDVLGLYYDDFILHYDRLLGDIDIIPMNDLPNAVEVTNVLSGSTSPIANVLTAVARETRLTEEPGGVDAAAAAPAGTRLFARKLSPKSRLFLQAMMQVQASQSGQEPPAPGQPVEDHFEWLHLLTAQNEGQPSELDALIDILKDVYQDLSNLNFAGGVGNPQDSSTALPRFQAAVGRIEDGPLKRWASQITVGSKGIATEGTRAGINAQWQQSVLPLCQRVTTNTYPFKRRANADAGLAEFSELFRPGGQMDAFFTSNLGKFVDTSKRPWTFKPGGGTDLGISQAVLGQFENAALIRDAFFAGGPVLNLSFQVTPEALDPKAKGILLEIDGQAVSFQHRDGTPRPFAIRWPGPVGAARVTFTPEQRNSESVILRNGPWSWFRMLDAAEVRNTNAPDRKRVIFNLGGRIAIFQMQSGTAINPFTLRALGEFSCPKSF